MIMIFNIFFIGVIFITLFKITYNLIRETKIHNKRMRKLKQWSNFHQQLMDWSKEISDVGIRVDFLNFCTNQLIKHSNQSLKDNMLDTWDVDKEKMKIYQRWGKNIPSLLQEIREKKLDSIIVT